MRKIGFTSESWGFSMTPDGGMEVFRDGEVVEDHRPRSEPEVTQDGRWLTECGKCGNVLRVKNLGYVHSVPEPCDGCIALAAGQESMIAVGQDLVSDQLGWCGCGSPERVDELMLVYLSACSGDYEPLEVDSDALIILAYIADREGWTEHGGSLPYAWLTDSGSEALANLRAKSDRPRFGDT